MYELRKGTMMLLTPNINDVEMYKKAGWNLVIKEKKEIKPVNDKKPVKNKKKTANKKEIDAIVEDVLDEVIVEQ